MSTNTSHEDYIPKPTVAPIIACRASGSSRRPKAAASRTQSKRFARTDAPSHSQRRVTELANNFRS